MDDLITFIRARLAEREQRALAASPGPWKANAEHDEIVAVDDITVADGFALSGPQLRATVDHIVDNDPDFVSADVKAKRQIIDGIQMCQACGVGRRCVSHDSSAGPLTVTRPAHPDDEQLIRLLALPFAGHSDYREEWRP